ncbi:nuclear RNA export factor 2 [Manduca sexta]|uniref:nuclear RNA export factor 2 n=1 Tax=Manduca sexta TaxID=7130 RepID=UPI00188FD4F9|nr:nuclear RNA export factor 2 [Manduca sexta]
MDWLKNPNVTGKISKKQKKSIKPSNKREFTGSSYPKGVPRSFLQQQVYQFPRTVRNLTWTNPRLQNPTSFKPIEAASSTTPQDDWADTSRDNVYSPSDIYEDSMTNYSDGSSDHELDWNSNTEEKQSNVYDRLGPPKPKVPNLTINLQMEESHTDRKVVVENVEDTLKYLPVDLREDIKTSRDPIVTTFLKSWPWKKSITVKKTISGRHFLAFTQQEQDKIQEVYDKPDTFVQVSITGYPSTWDKEDVLDCIIESVRGRTFIPCFVEFSKDECKFLVLQCRHALTALHNYGFNIRKDKVDLEITISLTSVTLQTLDFVPKLILRKIIASRYDGENKLNLKEFTLKKDISHFVYFPLNRKNNQMQIIDFAGSVAWDYIVELDLSHNRLTSIAGFDLAEITPRLRYLNLSHNLFDRLSVLICCRELNLESIVLEGNPVCNNYTDPNLYVEVIKTLFPTVTIIDGVLMPTKGQMPTFQRNYCPEEAKSVVEMVLEVYFPLLEASKEQRVSITHLYDEHASMTITFRNKLRFSPSYRKYQELLLRARCLEDGRVDSIEGVTNITKHMNKWPELEHDPTTFTVDVMHHTDTTTVIRVTGLLKLIAATLAEEEHLLAFTKTFILKTTDGVGYKIMNQMVYWDEPTKEYANGFKDTTVNRKNLSLKLDTAPNEELKEKFIEIFMKLANVDRTIIEKCLIMKDWHFKNALEHFIKLLRLDALDSLKEN